MSFLKITDWKKRDFIVIYFLKIRQNLHQDLLSERVGYLNTQYELSKLFKPVKDMQYELKEGIVSEIKLIRKRIKNLPQAITFPQFPSITACDDDGEEEENAVIEDIAKQYLSKFASVSRADNTLRDKDDKFYIGNK